MFNRYDRDNNFKESKGGENFSAQNVSKDEPVLAIPLEVRVLGNPDKAFRAFKSIVQKEKILSLFKQRQSYEKPSDKKRRKRSESRRKQTELELKQAQIASGEYDKIQERKQLMKDKKRKDREERRLNSGDSE